MHTSLISLHRDNKRPQTSNKSSSNKLTKLSKSTSIMLDRVAVVGGGPSGLAAAIALNGSGLLKEPVQVLEASSEAAFNSSAGAAVQITPNGLRALNQVAGGAVVQQILREGSEMKHVAMVLPSKARTYDHLQVLPDAPPSEYPSIMIRWGRLRQILAQQLPPGSVLCDQKVTGYERDGSNNKTVRLQLNNNNISEPYSFVIAADGKASIFRSTPLTASSTDPRINFKAVVKKRADGFFSNCDTTAYSFFAPTGIACFLGPAGSDGWTYWAISLPASMFPAVSETSTEQQHLEAIQSQLLATLSAHPECQAYVELIQATDASVIFVQNSTTAALTETLVVPDAPAVLLGDAGHAMSASYGQATSFGLEDAATLVHCLQQGQPLTRAVYEYSRLRRDRCIIMQQKSQERASRAMKGDPCNDITQWIHDWDVVKMEKTDDFMTVVG